MLSGFELYPRWVPLILLLREMSVLQRVNETDKEMQGQTQGAHFTEISVFR